MTTFEGTLAALRRLSGRLVFGDLESADGPVELVFAGAAW